MTLFGKWDDNTDFDYYLGKRQTVKRTNGKYLGRLVGYPGIFLRLGLCAIQGLSHFENEQLQDRAIGLAHMEYIDLSRPTSIQNTLVVANCQ